MSIKVCPLASLIDAAALDLLWQRATFSSHIALLLQASMDTLVVSRASRDLLALIQSSIMSSGGLTLQVLETAAIGEMLAGMSSREASDSSVLA